MKTKTFFFTCLIVFLLGLEIALRVQGNFKVHSERVGFWYRSYWNHTKKSWFHTWKPNTDFNFKESEFSSHYSINSLGVREKEFSENKKDVHTKRIICLGDSFTEGMGVEYEEAFPKILENSTKSACQNNDIEILNFGVSGSDILFSQKMLTEKLIHYHPDGIIVGINASDVTDIIQRGGVERFKPNGTSVYRKGPWFHFFYKCSHIVRLMTHEVFHFDNVFVHKSKKKQVYKEACLTIDKSIREIRDFCQQNDIDVVFYIAPLLSQYNFDQYRQRLPEKTSMEDSFQENCFLKDMETLIDVDVINLWMPLVDTLYKLDYEKFAWPINTHFNEYGYSLMAKYIQDAIIEHDSNFFCNKN